jgi:Chromate transporter
VPENVGRGAPRLLRWPPRAALFARFLKFGLLAWGGPAAQIAMIKRECVDEEGWVEEETFKKTQRPITPSYVDRAYKPQSTN